MYLKELKKIFCSKKSIIIMIGICLLYFMMFIFIKNKFYYEIINYIPKYLDYYTQQYVNGNVSSLIYDNNIWFFVENDVIGIFSSIYIYFASQQTIIFSILLFISPILLFYLIFDNLYYEIHNGYFKNIMVHKGKKKYFVDKFLSLLTFSGVFMLLPKLIYYLSLNMFFSPNVTAHYIDNGNFITEKFLYIKEYFSPQLLLCFDLGLSFLYGIIIAIISIIIIMLCNKKIYCYMCFILIIIIQAVVSITFNNISLPLIFLYSICESISVNPIFERPQLVVLQIFIILILLLGLLKFTLHKRIDEYI